MEQFAAVVFLAFLSAAANTIRGWVKLKLSPSRMTMLLNLARTVVGAADEVGAKLNLTGNEKLKYASNALAVSAKRVGLTLKPEETDAFIHAVLNEVHGFEAQLLQELGDRTEDAAAAVVPVSAVAA